MLAENTELPNGITAVIVDPLQAFTHRGGTYFEHYEGLSPGDTEPLCQLLPRIEAMIEAWHAQARLILCTSCYGAEDFVHDGSGLHGLCTPDNTFDRTPALGGPALARIAARMTKTRNSIYATDEHTLAEILERKMFILVGMTTNHCIRYTVEDTMQRPGRTVIIPLDLIAARRKQEAGALDLIALWSAATCQNVIVVPTWKNIAFDGVGTAL